MNKFFHRLLMRMSELEEEDHLITYLAVFIVPLLGVLFILMFL